jgi:hypothetical protein
VAAVGAARLGAHRPGGLLAVAALLLAAVAGLTFPDLDQSLPFFDHRSALTHSVLAALILTARRWLVPVAAGLALGLALHLAADCFPEAMRGYATVKVPFAGSLGGWSYLWLGANAAAGAWLFGRLLDDGVPDVRLRTITLGRHCCWASGTSSKSMAAISRSPPSGHSAGHRGDCGAASAAHRIDGSRSVRHRLAAIGTRPEYRCLFPASLPDSSPSMRVACAAACACSATGWRSALGGWSAGPGCCAALATAGRRPGPSCWR